MFLISCASVTSCVCVVFSTLIWFQALSGGLRGSLREQLATIMIAGALALCAPLLPIIIFHLTTRSDS
jgi:hypothetical protein